MTGAYHRTFAFLFSVCAATSQTPTGTRIDHVRYWGTAEGFQYLEVFGKFDRGNDLKLDCGYYKVQSQATDTYVSPSQINLRIPNNLLARTCQVSGAKVGDPIYEFRLPGLTCENADYLCPGAVRDVFSSFTSDGAAVRIEIRDGLSPSARFDEREIATIKELLAASVPEHLVNVSFVQAMEPVPPHPYLYVEDSRPGNGRGIYVPVRPHYWPREISNAVARLLFATLAKDDREEFRTKFFSSGRAEGAFAFLYEEWFSLHNYSLDQMLTRALGTSEYAAELQAQLVRLMLSMSSYFYVPISSQLRTYNGSWPPKERRVPVLRTREVIQLGAWVFNLNDDRVVGITRPGEMAQDRTWLPIQVPSRFSRVVPRS